MARLETDIKYTQLNASTLVEVLVAMTILLAVFAAGMLLLSNLARSSVSRSHKDMVREMHGLAEAGADAEIDLPSSVREDVVYYIMQEDLSGWHDLQRTTVYAERLVDRLLVDSVVAIRKRDEQ